MVTAARNYAPVMVSVPEDEWDSLRIDLATLRREVAQDCDAILNRLDRLIPAAVEIGPPALQLLIGATRKAESLRLRVTA